MTDYMVTWQEAAADAIAVLIAHPAAWAQATDAGVTADDMPPGNWRTVWLPIIEIAASLKLTEQRALLATEIAAKTGVAIDWLYEITARYDEWAESGFERTLQTLLTFGRGSRQLQTMTNKRARLLAALNNGGDTDEVVTEAVSELQIDRTQDGQHAVDLATLMVENRATMEAEPQPKTPTGIVLIDDWLGGGLSSNTFTAWVAPYKSRKTTVMVNVILAALERGEHLNIFTYDELRSDFIYRMEAVLMARYMWDTKQFNHPLNGVDMEMIRDAGKSWRTWGDPMPRAFEYAFDTLSSYGKRVKIYDAQTSKPTAQAIGALCKLDAQRWGQFDAIYFDNIQHMRGYGRLFENVEESSKQLNALRGELACRLWMLSQQNEEAIKGGDAGGHTPNVKGGGGLAAASDDIFVSKYRQEPHSDPKLIKIELRLSRHHESGVSDYAEVHPASGFITPRRNVVKHFDSAGYGDVENSVQIGGDA